MKFNPRVIRAYDVRGKADPDLHDDFVYALGQAYGSRIKRAGGQKVSVGRDCRVSGPRIFDAFQKGIRATGVDVISIGVVPTPLLYFSLHHLDVDGGVIVTGSHNPGDENGFKMCQGTASVYGQALQDMKRDIESGTFEAGEGQLTEADVLEPYFAWVADNIHPAKKKLKVVVDAGNGTGGPIGPRLYRAMGHEVIELFCEMDGAFPNHHPDPTVEANLVDLKAAVAEHGADLGIAFDGDADRIGAVDSRGRVAWGDQLLAFFAREILKDHPGATIVSEVKCSRVLFDDIAAHGGTPEMWKVGHALIKARMRETGALLAGEMSGHIFFKHRYFGYDDAPYVGARLLESISDNDTSLAALLDSLPQTVTTPELRVYCPDEVKFDVASRAAAHFKAKYDVIDIDGVRINFPTGWGLIRPSNTGPVLVMRFEADTEANLAAFRGEVEAWLTEQAPEVDLNRSDH